MLFEDAPRWPSLPHIMLTPAQVMALGDGQAVVIDHALSQAHIHQCWLAVEDLHRQGSLKPATIGRRRSHVPDVRGDWICWLSAVNDAPSLTGLWDWLDRLREEIRAAAWLPLHRFAVQISRYPPSGQYARHVDAMPGDPNRVLTAVLYLNEDWTPQDGGQLRVWEPDRVRDIEPIGGRLVLFLSEKLHHAVLPTHTPRTAITAWFRGAEAIPLLPDPHV